jgi:ABC-type sulfate/molybdate transport systems ATPase subunit
MSTDALHVDIRVGSRLDVRFTAAPGVTVLFGPSGAGKTTTLLAIAGLVQPSSGSIRLGDTVLFDDVTHTHVPVHQRHAGLVFQSLALFPHLTARDNVAFGMRGNRAQRRQQATQWLERLQVAHVADRRPHTFSGGEAQRVALARTLATEPRVLLLDEPFSALDDPLRVAIREDLQRILIERPIPVLFVTHDRSEARALADHVVVLAQGRVGQMGPTALS